MTISRTFVFHLLSTFPPPSSPCFLTHSSPPLSRVSWYISSGYIALLSVNYNPCNKPLVLMYGRNVQFECETRTASTSIYWFELFRTVVRISDGRCLASRGMTIEFSSPDTNGCRRSLKSIKAGRRKPKRWWRGSESGTPGYRRACEFEHTVQLRLVGSRARGHDKVDVWTKYLLCTIKNL